MRKKQRRVDLSVRLRRSMMKTFDCLHKDLFRVKSDVEASGDSEAVATVQAWELACCKGLHDLRQQLGIPWDARSLR